MFTRKKITIPAAGSSALVGVNGNSLIIESAPVYSSPEQVPVFFFDDPANLPQPIYPQSIYRSENKFNRLFVEGTQESAGDVIYILTTPDCLKSDINTNLTISRRSIQGTSFDIDSTDTAQVLPPASLVDSSGNFPSEIAITCQTNSVKYAFNTSPIQGAGNLGSELNPNNYEILRIQGQDAIEKFEFISAVGAAAGTLTVHLSY